MESVSDQNGTPRKWHEIWWQVCRHPGPTTFTLILQEADVSSERGFKWVALVSLGVILAGILGTLVGPNSSMLGNLFGSIAIYLVCGILLAPVFAVIGLALTAGLYHLIAKLFGGAGEWSRLVYCFAAIQAPLFLVSTVLSLMNIFLQQAGWLSLCALPFSLALGFYSLYQYISAISAVENISMWKSAGTYFAPTIAVLIIFLCVFSVTILPNLGR